MAGGGGPQNATGGHLIVNHPLHLLLADPSHAANGWFLINNRDALPADASLEAYDTSGALLLVDYFDVAGEGSRRVAWADLPAGTASIVLTSTNYVDAGLNVSIARGSPMIFGESQSRDLNLPPTTTNGTDILLYNPSEQTANVDLQGETTEAQVLWPHELRLVNTRPAEDGIGLRSDQSVVAMSAPLSDLVNGALAFRPPTSNQRLTQKFNVYCPPGPDGCGTLSGWHSGVDLGAVTAGVAGDPVFSVGLGKVSLVQPRFNSWGNHLMVKHLLESGDIFYSLFAHLQDNSFAVANNEQVVKGKQLARMGATGAAVDTYPVHLHFGVRKNLSDIGAGGFDHKSAHPRQAASGVR